MNEDITEEELESMQPSKVYRQCVKDRPKNVMSQPKATAEFESCMRDLVEDEKRQKVENVLNADIQLCDVDTHRNGFCSTCELMNALGNPSLVKTFALAELNDKGQRFKDFSEDITNAVNAENESMNDKVRAYWELTGSIRRFDQKGNAHLDRREWVDFVSEVKANIAVLQIGKRIVQPILESYTVEIAVRNDTKKIKQITNKMNDLAKQAAKLKSVIIQANDKAEKTKTKGHQIDIKTANDYIDSKNKFNDLGDQYSNLNKQLRFYTNEPLNILEFPGLASTDISTEHSIKKAWRRTSA
jgi:hypothetical protein